ncbi:ANTAR domain-containing protein [Flindersiella endophytica]
MSREQGLAQAFVELADARNAGFDDIYFMNVLARHCVDLVGWPAVAVLLADEHHVLHVAATWPGDLLATALEHPNEDGPCGDSYRGGTPVRLDLAGSGQPSRFAREAGDAGFTTVYAFPLQWRDDSIGSYALFTEQSEPPEPENFDLVQALAEAATITILRRRELDRAEMLAQQLQGALNSRVVIEQAKGILAERGHLDMEGAFDVLRSYARKNRTRLAVVAEEIVEGRIRPEQLLAG